MSQEVYSKLVDGFRLKHGLDIEDVLKNYWYCGGDTAEHLSKWKLYWDNQPKKRAFPPHTDQCVCDHPIEKQCYITNGTQIIVVGSKCIDNFLDGCILGCLRCEKKHRNQKYNLCNLCKKEPFNCLQCNEYHNNTKNENWCKSCLKEYPFYCFTCKKRHMYGLTSEKCENCFKKQYPFTCNNTRCNKPLAKNGYCNERCKCPFLCLSDSCYKPLMKYGYCDDGCKPKCIICNNVHTNENSDYCSQECSNKSICKTCNIIFDNEDKSILYCSDQCFPLCLKCKTPLKKQFYSFGQYCTSTCYVYRNEDIPKYVQKPEPNVVEINVIPKTEPKVVEPKVEPIVPPKIYPTDNPKIDRVVDGDVETYNITININNKQVIKSAKTYYGALEIFNQFALKS